MKLPPQDRTQGAAEMAVGDVEILRNVSALDLNAIAETDLPPRRALRKLIAERRLDAYVKRVVESAPPLTVEQQSRLAILFNSSKKRIS